MTRGRFITFEGGEGAGKTTQIARLRRTLEARGTPVLVTREPGGTEGGEAIRALLVNGPPGRWDPLTEAMLNFAARREHVRRRIEPALAAGSWVLCDRFADSTTAYQGAGQGVPPDAIGALYRLAVGTLAPDLTLVLDLPPEIGLARAAARRDAAGDRFERMEAAFHARLRQAFLDIAAAEPDRCRVVDATADPDHVAAAVAGMVDAAFSRAAG